MNTAAPATQTHHGCPIMPPALSPLVFMFISTFLSWANVITESKKDANKNENFFEIAAIESFMVCVLVL